MKNGMGGATAEYGHTNDPYLHPPQSQTTTTVHLTQRILALQQELSGLAELLQESTHDSHRDNELQQRLQQLTTQNEALEKIIQSKDETISMMEQDMHSLEAELSQLQSENAGQEASLSRLQEEMNHSAHSRPKHSQELEDKVMELNEQISTLLAQVQQLMGENEQHSGQYQQIQEESRSIGEENRRLTEQLEGERRERREEIAMHQEEVRYLKEEIKSVEEIALQTQHSMAGKRSQAEQALRKQKRELTVELSQLQRNYQSTRRELQSLSSLHSQTTVQLSLAQQQIASLRQEHVQSRTKHSLNNSQLHHTIHQQRQQIQQLIDRQQAMRLNHQQQQKEMRVRLQQRQRQAPLHSQLQRHRTLYEQLVQKYDQTSALYEALECKMEQYERRRSITPRSKRQAPPSLPPQHCSQYDKDQADLVRLQNSALRQQNHLLQQHIQHLEAEIANLSQQRQLLTQKPPLQDLRATPVQHTPSRIFTISQYDLQHREREQAQFIQSQLAQYQQQLTVSQQQTQHLTLQLQQAQKHAQLAYQQGRNEGQQPKYVKNHSIVRELHQEILTLQRHLMESEMVSRQQIEKVQDALQAEQIENQHHKRKISELLEQHNYHQWQPFSPPQQHSLVESHLTSFNHSTSQPKDKDKEENSPSLYEQLLQQRDSIMRQFDQSQQCLASSHTAILSPQDVPPNNPATPTAQSGIFSRLRQSMTTSSTA